MRQKMPLNFVHEQNKRNRAVCKHLDGFTTEHNRGDAAAAMGCHHDCITFSSIRRVDNRFIGLIMLDAQQILSAQKLRDRRAPIQS
jgi:hypothetical protein